MTRSVFAPLPQDIAPVVRNAVENARRQLGRRSPAAERFASRAERFLRRERLPGAVFKSFLEDVRMWSCGRRVNVREDMVTIMRRAFAVVGALRTAERRGR